MKKTYLLLFLLFTSFSFAQTHYDSDQFIVTLKDISSKTFDKDSTANALVIYESGKSFVGQGDYRLHTKFKHKIKILNKDGFDKATVKIYLYKTKSSSEKVKNILATSYNLVEGTNKVITRKLDKSNIYEEKYNDNYTIVKFTLPNVKVGSVITYSYETVSPFMFNYKSWHFQEDIPKLYSEYKTSIPANWIYNIKLIGYKPLDINTRDIEKNCLEGARGASSGCSLSHYAMKDIPAFIEEEYMTSDTNYKARIEYELKTFQGFDGVTHNYTKTWETVDDELRKDPNIGKQLSKSVDLPKLLPQTVYSIEDNLERAKSIYHYVQTHYTWNGDYKIFKDVDIKDLIKTKSGNVSEINILLHNLLKESNIDVKPVLISTRNNGFPTKIHPVISDFNYLIVQANINGKSYSLDATDKFLDFAELPFRCLNQHGRLLDFKKGSNWMDIKVENISKVFYNVDLKANDEFFSGSVQSKITGYHALNKRKDYFPNSQEYFDALEKRNENLEISNIEIDCEKETSSEFKESYDLEYFVENSGDNVYINPFLVTFFNENPFKLQERTYPIDFGYKDTYYYALKLNLNEKYELVEAPEDFKIVLPNNTGTIALSTKQVSNELIMTFRINFNKALYAQDYYPYLKKFMSKIVEIQNNSIVLLKKIG
ncbi:DUF3857 domain-containing protein [Algibacter mikhailovii]|uniref:DUF3857 domain-containing protein n=1 Tax=Algibacter mikhailovii TaxID=425498 RepID=A0A918V442_9FLAO|nr:DUF3857 domain-containing protein [Algibacter mikhailovii]GGZ67847.1 hypothetical protein GCM10007028_00930 [Algibacter mikhailovii]